MATVFDSARLLTASPASYAARLAQGVTDIHAAQALRFQVFNVELKEGLTESWQSGLDRDPFDEVCDHLVVEYRPTSQIVGTYRMQTGANAAARIGYYCEQEFDFSALESVRGQTIELGRACVLNQHRNLAVLGILWKGIADYAAARNARYLVGCSSITSQDPAVGASTYSVLCRKHLAPPEWRTGPRANYDCPLTELHPDPVSIPKLLRAYLALGAWICGPPALDRQFKTIDFLTLLDLDRLPALVWQKFLG